MRAANGLARLYLSTVSPEPSLNTLKKGIKMKVHAKFYRLVQESLGTNRIESLKDGM